MMTPFFFFHHQSRHYRVIVVRTEELFEGERKVLSIFNWEGHRIGPHISFVGTDYILAQSSRILLAQKSSHVIVTESVLIDPDANKVAKIKQPEFVREFGISSDQKLFWIVSNPVSETGPLTRVEVCDVDGKGVGNLESRSARVWRITEGGVDYQINVPAPDWPG